MPRRKKKQHKPRVTLDTRKEILALLLNPNNYTQQSIADHVGVSNSTVSKIAQEAKIGSNRRTTTLNKGKTRMVDFSRAQGAHAASLDFSKAQTIQAGQRINFSKEQAGVTRIRAELHWDSAHDADASVILQDSLGVALKGLKPNAPMVFIDGREVQDPNATRGMVWYNNLDVPGVVHTGDARTSDGDPSAPEETIKIDLANLQTDAEGVIIVASTFPEDDAGEGKAVPFGLIRNCRVDVINDATNEVLFCTELDEDFSTHTSVELLRFYKRNGDWRMTALNEPVGTSIRALEDIATKYGLV